MILFIQASAIGVFCGVWGFGGSKKNSSQETANCAQKCCTFQGVKGLGHSIGQTNTVVYGVRRGRAGHLANGNKTCRRLFTVSNLAE